MTSSSWRSPSAILLCGIQDQDSSAAPVGAGGVFGRFALLPCGQALMSAVGQHGALLALAHERVAPATGRGHGGVGLVSCPSPVSSC